MAEEMDLRQTGSEEEGGLWCLRTLYNGDSYYQRVEHRVGSVRTVTVSVVECWFVGKIRYFGLVSLLAKMCRKVNVNDESVLQIRVLGKATSSPHNEIMCDLFG